MIVHHFALAAAGFIVRGHCMLPHNPAILIGLEVSTLFLNFAFMYRNTAVLMSCLFFVIMCQPLRSDTGQSVAELHLQIYLRNVSDGVRLCLIFLFDELRV